MRLQSVDFPVISDVEMRQTKQKHKKSKINAGRTDSNCGKRKLQAYTENKIQAHTQRNRDLGLVYQCFMAAACTIFSRKCTRPRHAEAVYAFFYTASTSRERILAYRASASVGDNVRLRNKSCATRRVHKEFKLLEERQEKKERAERQAREKKEEAERQERKEKKEADRKERLELEKMKLDAEMKLLQAKIEAGIIKNEPDGSGARSSDAGAKHPKLPNFQDGRGDLDIWLTRFETFAESNGWSREKWSSSLCALLTGRALDCYGRLSAEQAKDYDKVKEALMKRYDLTEDGYRRKFRTCKLAEGESPDMFIVRIVTYLDRWIKLFKTDKSYEKLEDLIVREQFMDACPEDLSTSLREKDLPTLERVAKEADLFLKARNRKLCDQPRKLFQSNAGPRMDSVRPLEPEKKFNGGQRAREAKTSVANQRSCFKCK
ncbi:retroviral-like aspartic protease 1 [Plakobranchus ocellatus]|uniref:Retroviral-like aspartic protease 1 n=1 Tax=Plakobranchus ocellatus TaxID=259542 RepID=A0AAV3YUY8_9GAST|nr:retroviral-like aspartic protease 1 [Plakobranchus ocellatus]